MLWSDLKQTGEPVSACEQSGYSVFNASRSSSVMHTRGLNWVNASMIDGLEGGSGGVSRAEGGRVVVVRGFVSIAVAPHPRRLVDLRSRRHALGDVRPRVAARRVVETPAEG